MAASAEPAQAKEVSTPPDTSGGQTSMLMQWLPIGVAVILAPVLSWAVAQFILFPRLKAQIASAPQTASAPAGGGDATHPASAPAVTEKADKSEKAAPEGKKGDKKAGPSVANYEFSNVVVNLAGTMGTRYLKTTFLVGGSDSNLHAVFENNKAKLTDVALNVLSSLTLADLEEAGSKNLIREKLILAFNQALGQKIAETVYFSDFVVQ